MEDTLPLVQSSAMDTGLAAAAQDTARPVPSMAKHRSLLLVVHDRVPLVPSSATDTAPLATGHMVAQDTGLRAPVQGKHYPMTVDAAVLAEPADSS